MTRDELPVPLRKLEPESTEIVLRCLRGELAPDVLLDLAAHLEDMNRADGEMSDAIDSLYLKLTGRSAAG